jgi:hypothetical protein
MRLDGKLVVVDELNGRFGFVAKGSRINKLDN